MILSPLTIKEAGIINPFVWSHKVHGVSTGASHAGYDIALDGDYIIYPGFKLVSAQERFNMPLDVVGIVHDKSTWARQGLTVQNTVIEPGWKGFLTLELVNHTDVPIELKNGVGIAQVIFHTMNECVSGYRGKYQNQEAGPQKARFD